MRKFKGSTKSLALGVMLASLLTGVSVDAKSVDIGESEKSNVIKSSSLHDERLIKNYAQPTVLLHGFGGDGTTFRSTLGDFDHGDKFWEKGLTSVKSKFYKKVDGVSIYNSGQDAVILVSSNKKATYIDVPSKKESSDIVEVIFKNNKESLLVQQGYFNLAMDTLDKHYKTKNKGLLRVNLVGEGMGGLTVSKYALDRVHRKAHVIDDIPFVKSILTLQTPFLGVEKDWKNTCKSFSCTQAYRDLVKDSVYIQKWFFDDMLNDPKKLLNANTAVMSVYANDLSYGKKNSVNYFVKAGSAQGIKAISNRLPRDFNLFLANNGHNDIMDNRLAIEHLKSISTDLTSDFNK